MVPVTEPIVEENVEPEVVEEPEYNVYGSCVATARQIYPDIPLMDAIEYKANGTVENSEIVLLQYPSKVSDGYIYHIAPYILEGDILHIYNEGNFVAGEKTERDISINDEHILGYWDLELWQKIQELPEDAIATLRCESHFKMYNPDGSILRGKDGEWGIGQFMSGTWKWFSSLRQKEGLRMLDILNPYDQVELVSWAWQNDMQSHWVCYNMTHDIID